MSADLATQNDTQNAAAEPAQLFVINLCASTSPMALSHPNTPELKRFTFFVSRQREDGRERFRLHMGYFASQEEAEALLAGRARCLSGCVGRSRAHDRCAASCAHVGCAARSPYRRLRRSPWPLPLRRVPWSLRPQWPRRRQLPSPDAPAPAAQAESLDAMSNVRDVLAQLSESAPRTDAGVPAAEPVAPSPVRQTLNWMPRRRCECSKPPLFPLFPSLAAASAPASRTAPAVMPATPRTPPAAARVCGACAGPHSRQVPRCRAGFRRGRWTGADRHA